jgi:hypothetical protein
MMTPEDLEAIRRRVAECAKDTADRRALLAEVDRLHKLFDDAGQGEHNVLALVEYYQDATAQADQRISSALALLEESGCECECDHHPDERAPDCVVCLPCRIEEALRGVTP